MVGLSRGRARRSVDQNSLRNSRIACHSASNTEQGWSISVSMYSYRKCLCRCVWFSWLCVFCLCVSPLLVTRHSELASQVYAVVGPKSSGLGRQDQRKGQSPIVLA